MKSQPGKISSPLWGRTCAFDLINRELIWLDVAIRPRQDLNYNVATNQPEVSKAFYALLKQRPLTLCRFLELAASRVDYKSEANLVLDATSSEQMLSLLV